MDRCMRAAKRRMGGKGLGGLFKRKAISKCAKTCRKGGKAKRKGCLRSCLVKARKDKKRPSMVFFRKALLKRKCVKACKKGDKACRKACRSKIKAQLNKKPTKAEKAEIQAETPDKAE